MFGLLTACGRGGGAGGTSRGLAHALTGAQHAPAGLHAARHAVPLACDGSRLRTVMAYLPDDNETCGVTVEKAWLPGSGTGGESSTSSSEPRMKELVAQAQSDLPQSSQAHSDQALTQKRTRTRHAWHLHCTPSPLAPGRASRQRAYTPLSLSLLRQGAQPLRPPCVCPACALHVPCMCPASTLRALHVPCMCPGTQHSLAQAPCRGSSRTHCSPRWSPSRRGGGRRYSRSATWMMTMRSPDVRDRRS